MATEDLTERACFRQFLQDVCPDARFDITVLSGGLINETVRATALQEDDIDHHEQPQTLILKYAPPYIAALGPTAPFGQQRQVCFRPAFVHPINPRLGNVKRFIRCRKA